VRIIFEEKADNSLRADGGGLAALGAMGVSCCFSSVPLAFAACVGSGFDDDDAGDDDADNDVSLNSFGCKSQNVYKYTSGHELTPLSRLVYLLHTGQDVDFSIDRI
jgi:hypothetical protein